MKYTAILRASSYVTLKRGEALELRLPGAEGVALIRLRTVYKDYPGLRYPLPSHMVALVEGTQRDLNSALTEANTLVNFVLPILAFTGNGRILEAQYHFIYDSAPDLDRRTFAQFTKPVTEELSVAINLVDASSISKVFDAITTSDKRGALYVAVTQYALALRSWLPRYHLAVVSHIFMGMEALKPVAVAEELKRQGITKAELAENWGVKTSALENEARLRLLFAGNFGAHRDAKDASDGYEHGDDDFAPLNEKAERCRDAALGYLRAAILRYLHLDQAVVTALQTGTARVPPEPGGFVGLTGDLPRGFDSAAGADIDFELFRFGTIPSNDEGDPEGGNYKLNMTVDSTCQLKTGDINVSGVYFVRGTNLVKAPFPTAVKRAQ